MTETEELDPIKALKAARETLVKERRGLAIALALGYRRRRTDDFHATEMRESFVGLQALIEAVERAISHEDLLSNERAQTAVHQEAGSIKLAIC
ncbi:MAG: hypothetical protein WCB49_00020 [Gammaproteobacteria bacterium]